MSSGLLCSERNICSQVYCAVREINSMKTFYVWGQRKYITSFINNMVTKTVLMYWDFAALQSHLNHQKILEMYDAYKLQRGNWVIRFKWKLVNKRGREWIWKACRNGQQMVIKAHYLCQSIINMSERIGELGYRCLLLPDASRRATKSCWQQETFAVW